MTFARPLPAALLSTTEQYSCRTEERTPNLSAQLGVRLANAQHQVYMLQKRHTISLLRTPSSCQAVRCSGFEHSPEVLQRKQFTGEKMLTSSNLKIIPVVVTARVSFVFDRLTACEGRELSLERLQSVYEHPISRAAAQLNIGVTVLKKYCRWYSIDRWPYRKIRSVDKLIEQLDALGEGDTVPQASG